MFHVEGVELEERAVVGIPLILEGGKDLGVGVGEREVSVVRFRLRLGCRLQFPVNLCI